LGLHRARASPGLEDIVALVAGIDEYAPRETVSLDAIGAANDRRGSAT
jgi:hypothetical protein